MPSYTFYLGSTPELSLLEISSLLDKKYQVDSENRVAIEFENDDAAKEFFYLLGGSIELKKLEDGQEKLITRHSWKNWIKRDRNKPYADHKKGMLPPKVARILINISIGIFSKSKPEKINSKQTTNSNVSNLKNYDLNFVSDLDFRASNLLLFDPFCGTGTVLMEAKLLGLNVIGSDLDIDAVEGTQKNLSWLEREYHLEKNQSKVFKADATQVNLEQLGSKVDIIVTEPFLGKPRPKPEDLKNIFKGLEKQYLGSFKNWTKILNDGAVLVVIFPEAENGRKKFSLEHLIDRLENLGYNLSSDPVAYYRPDAIIKRKIYIFKYHVTR